MKAPLLAIALTVVAMLAVQASARADSDKEFAVEAAFVYQFTNYFEWPGDPSGAPDTGPFIITLVGESPLCPYFDKLAQEKTVKGRKIEVHRVSDPAKLGKAHIIVMTSPSLELLRETARVAKGALIVGYAENFAKNGAIVNFFEQDGRLRFEVNRSAAESQKFKISSQLLKLARLVD